MRYYSAESIHGNETSHGFANDTVVMVWRSKRARDKYVAESNNLSCEAIKHSEVTQNATNRSLTQNRDIKPRPFYGEYWAIVEPQIEEDGLIGYVECVDDSNPLVIERFYK